MDETGPDRAPNCKDVLAREQMLVDAHRWNASLRGPATKGFSSTRARRRKAENINDLTFGASGTDIGWVSGLHTIQRKVEWRPFCKECSNANVAAERGRGILPRSRH